MDVLLMVFIMLITDSFWAGLGVSFVLGIGISILGGGLEFREHRIKEVNKIIDFPAQSQIAD